MNSNHAQLASFTAQATRSCHSYDESYQHLMRFMRRNAINKTKTTTTTAIILNDVHPIGVNMAALIMMLILEFYFRRISSSPLVQLTTSQRSVAGVCVCVCRILASSASHKQEAKQEQTSDYCIGQAVATANSKLQLAT